MVDHLIVSYFAPEQQGLDGKDVAGGYAGLNADARVTKGIAAVDDVIIDLSTKGLVLKDAQEPAHYWRIGVSVLGVVVAEDLGTSRP